MDRDALICRVADMIYERGAEDWARNTATEILDAIAPAIRAAALEEAATYIECGCPQRGGVAELAHNSAARWRLCGNDPCGAIEAAAIRALINDPPATP